MCYCADLIAYLDDDTDKIPYPCDGCEHLEAETGNCVLKNLNEAQTAYDVVKATYPIKTTAKPGCDIHALVQKEFPDLYKQVYALPLLDWNDLDGVLDFLYGHYKLFDVKELKPMIDFIEAHCEVKK